MRDPAWLDDDLREDATPRRVRPLLVVLAALPWLVVVALFVLPGGSSPANPGPGESPGGGPTDLAQAEPGVAASGPGVGTSQDGVSESDASEDPGSSDDGHDEDGTIAAAEVAAPYLGAQADDLAAVALLAARSWLSDIDRHDDALTSTTRDGTQYAEHLALEGLDGDQDLVVARVIALLLDVDTATAPRLKRVAVPLAATPAGPRLLGEPWELPTPTPDTLTLSTETLTDPVLIDAAEQALRDADFSEPRVQRLARTAGWPLIVTFVTGEHDQAQQVWLGADTGGRLAVAGQRPTTDPTDRRPGGVPDPLTDAGDRS